MVAVVTEVDVVVTEEAVEEVFILENVFDLATRYISHSLSLCCELNILDVGNFQDEARGLELIRNHDPTIGHAMAVVTLILVSDRNAIAVTLPDRVVVVVALDQCEVAVVEDGAIDRLPTDGPFLLPIIGLLCYVLHVIELKIEQNFSEVKVERAFPLRYSGSLNVRIRLSMSIDYMNSSSSYLVLHVARNCCLYYNCGVLLFYIICIVPISLFVSNFVLRIFIVYSYFILTGPSEMCPGAFSLICTIVCFSYFNEVCSHKKLSLTLAEHFQKNGSYKMLPQDELRIMNCCPCSF